MSTLELMSGDYQEPLVGIETALREQHLAIGQIAFVLAGDEIRVEEDVA